MINKIELIDFPGIDVDDEIISNYFNNLVQLSDTFIFVNDCKLVKNEGNIDTIQKIITRIKNRKFDFDYNSCLFVLNKADKDKSGQINTVNYIIQKKKEFEEILFDNYNYYFFDFFKKKKNPEIFISIFSSRFFLNYLSFYDSFNNYENYINKKILEIKEKNISKKNYDLIKLLEDKIINTIKIEFYFDKIGINNISKNIKEEEKSLYLEKLKACLKNNGIEDNIINSKKENLNNIICYYIYIKNNLNKNQYYIKSNIDTFTNDLENKFLIAKNMTEKQYSDKIKQFINTFQTIFKLLQQKSINNKMINMTDAKERLNEKITEIHETFRVSKNKITNQIDEIFTNLIEKINYLIKLGKSDETKVSDLKNKIEEFRQTYIKDTRQLNDFIDEEIVILQTKLNNRIKSEFYKFGIIPNEENRSLWKTGLIYFGMAILVVPSAISLLITGIIMFFSGIVGNIINSLKGKDSLLKDLNKLQKEISEQWNSTIFRMNTVWNKSLVVATRNIKILYETQMSKINEKNLQYLYEKFIHIIGDNYEGDIKDNLKHGYGIYTWFDGSKYEGHYQKDFREGYGKMKWIEGAKYEGYWKKGSREGFGKYYLQTGSYYIGEFIDDKFWGKGKYISYDKSLYEGEFNNDSEEGFGIFTYKEGDKYIGEFKEDLFCGIGIMNYNSGNKYEGEYNNGKNGIGTFYYSDGKKFEGEWKNNKKNGKGIFYTKEGKVFEGYWKGNRKVLTNYIDNSEYIKSKEIINNNSIKIEYMDGDIYQGEYNPLTKVIEGKGKYIFNHGQIYIGLFKNNFFNGEGKIIFEKNITSGMFKDGELNGEGEIEYENGNILKGVFKNGKKEGIFMFYNKSNGKTDKRLYQNNKYINTLQE